MIIGTSPALGKGMSTSVSTPVLLRFSTVTETLFEAGFQPVTENSARFLSHSGVGRVLYIVVASKPFPLFDHVVSPIFKVKSNDMADREIAPELRVLQSCVMIVDGENFTPFKVSKFDAFRIPSSVFKRNMAEFFKDNPTNNDDIAIWGNEDRRVRKYHINDFEDKIIKKKGVIDHIDCVSKSSGFTFRKDSSLDSYKVFIPKLWGNLSLSAGIGGAYADVMIASPMEICSYSYNVCGISANKEGAIHAAKYLLTKFLRAMLTINKKGKDATSENFQGVPTQDFHEDWWNESIAQIDEHLFDKYNVPDDIRSFVRNNIQTRSEGNIINLL